MIVQIYESSTGLEKFWAKFFNKCEEKKTLKKEDDIDDLFDDYSYEDFQQQLTAGNFFSSEEENSWQMFEGNGEPWFGFFGSYEE